MIKTKQIKTAKATILVVDGLPEDANRFKFFNDEEPYLSYFVGSETFREYNIPPGKWQSVGFLDKVTEEEAKELVGRFYDFDMIPGYSDDNMIWRKATEALHSLVEANCKMKNKYGEKPIHPDYKGWNLLEQLQKENEWQAEEKTVFRNPFILKKID